MSIPKAKNSTVSGTRKALSTLLMTRKTGLSERCNRRATSSSITVTPTSTSTTNRIVSASSMATSTCWSISASKVSSPPTISARIDQGDLFAVPVCFSVMTVTSYSTCRIYNSFSALNETIEKRRLSNIGPSDNGNKIAQSVFIYVVKLLLLRGRITKAL